MKQNTKFNFGNIGIGYWSIIGRYIGIDPKKAMSVDLLISSAYLENPP